MKEAIKEIIPQRFQPFAQRVYRRVYRKNTYRKTARYTTMQYDYNSVLQCCIAYNQYGGYCVPLSSIHRPAVQKILSGDVYEPRTIEFIMSHCQDGDIVHAGTYFGDFLPALSRSCTPDAKIWAYEPNPENYRCAIMTLCINGLENVELKNAGLGERQHSNVMVTTNSQGIPLGGASRIISGHLKNFSGGKEEKIQIVTIDDQVPVDRNISIIQLDVEGYEKEVLSGAINTIKRCLPIIILENLPDENWLNENILNLGYKVKQKVHGNTVLTCD